MQKFDFSSLFLKDNDFNLHIIYHTVNIGLSIFISYPFRSSSEYALLCKKGSCQ